MDHGPTADANGRACRVLVVDDDRSYRQMVRRLIEREGHEVLTAGDGPEALEILRTTAVDLVLLDYLMPGMTGEEVVSELRSFNQTVQVVLQTGYASEHPPRDMLRRLDIQGFHDKSEGPEKLLLWTDLGVRAALTVQMLEKSRVGLRYVLDTVPELHRVQPLEELLELVLERAIGLLATADSILVDLPEDGAEGESSIEGFLALVEEGAGFEVRAATSAYEHLLADEAVYEETRDLLRKALTAGEVTVQGGATVVPLGKGQTLRGALYLDSPMKEASDRELLEVFASQAALAIQSTLLYEMATRDPLTGTHVRRFFDQWLLKEVRATQRSGEALSLIMIDVDNMKQINDRYGHPAGDRVLAAVGDLLREGVRGSDLVARYGGDEFAVVLPRTGSEAAGAVAERVFLRLEGRDRPADGREAVQISMGIATLRGFDEDEDSQPAGVHEFVDVAEELVDAADRALYDAKRGGGSAYRLGREVSWQSR